MGELIKLLDHARASTAGRSTESGQGTSSGHCSANQAITSSYLRAVKVFPSSSSLSKKRQSPAARRPKVAKLTDRVAAYAEAHAMRFDRSSDSMTEKDSRKIPTAQEDSVGKFRLADMAVMSDKSAMPSVEQIRYRIQKAMDGAGEGAVSVAVDMGFERNHLRDFLEGKKQSLKTEVMLAISERYHIPFKDLIITKEKTLRRAAG
jgi:hypothetical protein